MPVPTHDASCQTRIWETRCPSCGSVVFFFSCSCGSKVFFDLNHPPWNPHEDSCIAYLIAYLRDVESYSPEVIWQRVVEHANARGVSIPAGIREEIFGPRPTGQRRIRPIDVLPTDGQEVRTDGQIMKIDQVNFFRRFNYVDNVLGRAILGDLIRRPHMEITLREDPDEETGYSNQYTFFVPQAQVARVGLRQNSRATAILVTRRVAGRRIWVAESIDQPW